MHLAKSLLELAMECPACASLANQQGPMLSKDCSAVIGTRSRPSCSYIETIYHTAAASVWWLGDWLFGR